MSGRRNTVPPGAVSEATSPSGSPIIVELESDSSDDDVEVSRYTGYPRIRTGVRFSRPPSTIDLESLCEVESERHRARSPLPSTSTGAQTDPIPGTAFQTIKNQRDENPTNLAKELLTEIQKMKAEKNELKEKISSLEERVTETETAFSLKESEVEQGQREIGILHQSLDKMNVDFKEKEKEAEKLCAENSSLQKSLEETSNLFKDNKKKAEQLREENSSLNQRLDKITVDLNDMIKEAKQLRSQNTSIQQRLEASEGALKIKEKETDQLQKRNSSLQQKECEAESALTQRDTISRLLKTRIYSLQQRLFTSDRALEKAAQETENHKATIESQRKELADVKNKHKELNSLYSNLKQKGQELEKTLHTKNDILGKVAEEKMEFEHKSVSYHEENKRLTFQLKKQEEIKQQCMKLLSSSLEPQPAAAAGTSEASDLEVSCNDPPTNHQENNNSMDNQNDAGTSAVLLTSKSSHGIITRLSSGSLERRSVTALVRGGMDASTPNCTKTGPAFHKVDDSATAGTYRCICGRVLVSNNALAKHILTNSEGVLCNRCSRTFQTKAGLRSHVKSCLSNPSTPNEDLRTGVKRKRNHVPDDAIP
ncbi:unnamed protein product [Orchesella dallaii]|uniref:C2H2-type domain-containing protein n=1 Tax=Orchesella dallaii TaxID=48710 RepID=A0ABP1Q7G5_9HEXA